jgi:hypothetical protein
MGKRGGHSAAQVEDKEAKMSQGRLHIVTEYIKVEHVAQQVHPSAVEEDGGNKGEDRIVYQLGRFGEDGDHLPRNNPECVDKLLQVWSEGQLEQEGEHVGPDEDIGYKGDRPGGDVVTERDHIGSR